MRAPRARTGSEPQPRRAREGVPADRPREERKGSVRPDARAYSEARRRLTRSWAWSRALDDVSRRARSSAPARSAPDPRRPWCCSPQRARGSAPRPFRGVGSQLGRGAGTSPRHARDVAEVGTRDSIRGVATPTRRIARTQPACGCRRGRRRHVVGARRSPEVTVAAASCRSHPNPKARYARPLPAPSASPSASPSARAHPSRAFSAPRARVPGRERVALVDSCCCFCRRARRAGSGSGERGAGAASGARCAASGARRV